MDESNDPNDKGFAIVGEPGPELPYIPPNTTIIPNPIAPLTYSLQVPYNPYSSVCSGGGSLLTFGSLISHHSPEMIFIPPNPAFGYLEIVRAVAETDVTYSTYLDFDDVPCGWACPFCDGKVPGRMSEVPEFPHDQDCIVIKARAMVEAMPHVEVKE